MFNVPFKTADILIPKNQDMTKWSVIACDQYNSQPEYWEEVENFVGDAPSTLKIFLPEVYLKSGNLEQRVDRINSEMVKYLDNGLFDQLHDSFIYLRRTLSDGKVREGLIGAIDLEAYDFSADSSSLVRATEGTVVERIPPRVKIRRGASLELPHVMVLIDDPDMTVISPLAEKIGRLEKKYDFELMQNSGRSEGYSVCGKDADGIIKALSDIYEKAALSQHGSPVLFSVGDGNHSLATAKTCFEEFKKTVPESIWKNHPSRYTLVEIVNIHDASLNFEPIHRSLFGVDAEKAAKGIKEVFKGAVGGLSVEYITAGKREKLQTGLNSTGLVFAAVQKFIDDFLKENDGSVDYIHGDDVAEKFGLQSGNISFMMPPLDKSSFFDSISSNGAFPRKTFSMGVACDKRFYLECRKIK